MPGKPLLGFSAAKAHLSIFPFSPAAIDAVKDRLEGFDLAKGTIRFSPEASGPRTTSWPTSSALGGRRSARGADPAVGDPWRASRD